MSDQPDNRTLFEKLYDKGKEALKSVQKPAVKRSIRRALESAFDNAEDQRLKAQKSLEDEYAKLDKFNVNSAIEFKETMRKADVTKEHLKDIHREIFSEELKLRD